MTNFFATIDFSEIKEKHVVRVYEDESDLLFDAVEVALLVIDSSDEEYASFRIETKFDTAKLWGVQKVEGKMIYPRDAVTYENALLLITCLAGTALVRDEFTRIVTHRFPNVATQQPKPQVDPTPQPQVGPTPQPQVDPTPQPQVNTPPRAQTPTKERSWDVIHEERLLEQEKQKTSDKRVAIIRARAEADTTVTNNKIRLSKHFAGLKKREKTDMVETQAHKHKAEESPSAFFQAEPTMPTMSPLPQPTSSSVPTSSSMPLPSQPTSSTSPSQPQTTSSTAPPPREPTKRATISPGHKKQVATIRKIAEKAAYWASLTKKEQNGLARAAGKVMSSHAGELIKPVVTSKNGRILYYNTVDHGLVLNVLRGVYMRPNGKPPGV